jgi:uncharacterized protein YjiS (DUF1127 family)
MATIALTDLGIFAGGSQRAALRSPNMTRVRRHLTFAIGVERRLHALWLRGVAWHMRRVTRAALGALDARTLRDIGLDRSEIESAARDLDVVLAWRSRVARRQFRAGA